MTKSALKEFNKIKKRLVKEFNVEFPVEQNKRKGMEFRIQHYENLSDKSKLILGSSYEELYERLKDSLNRGVNVLGDPLD